MRYTINRKSLKAIADKLARVVEKKATIPILTGIRIEVAAGCAALSGTDLEVAIIEAGPVDTGAESGVAVIALEPLRKALTVADDSVTITVDSRYHEGEDGARFVGSASIDIGAGVVSLPCFDPISYPDLPNPGELRSTLDLPSFQSAIEATSPAISPEQSRFTLNGALLDISQDSAQLVATDGHRLHIAPVSGLAESSASLLIPRLALTCLANVEGETVDAYSSEDYMHFVCGGSTVMARKLKGNFPEYRRVMPDLSKKSPFTVARAELSRALKAAAPFTDKRSSAASFTINGKLTLATKAEHPFKANIASNGWEHEETPFTLSVDYLRDAIASVKDDRITFYLAKIQDPERAAALKCGIDGPVDLLDSTTGARVVLMPMRD